MMTEKLAKMSQGFGFYHVYKNFSFAPGFTVKLLLVSIWCEIALSNHTGNCHHFQVSLVVKYLEGEIADGTMLIQRLYLSCAVFTIWLYLVPTHFMYIFNNVTLDR